MRSLPSSPAGEIIEDSEPERERERIAFKAKRRQERRIKNDLELTLSNQRHGSQTSTRSSGTGEGYSHAGPSSARNDPIEVGEACWSTLPDRNGRAHHPPRSTSPTRRSPTAITTSAKPVDISSFAYSRGPLQRSASSSSAIAHPPQAADASTTSSHFAPRPPPAVATSVSLEPRRSKSKSVDPIDATPECSFKDVEMRRIKKCVLCGEDWSAPGKKSRTKWAHLINCNSTVSHSSLLGLIRDYLAITKAGGKQPRSLLEKKMFALKEEQDDRDGLDEPQDAVMAVDGSKLGKRKARAPSRSTSAVSESRRVASNEVVDLDDEDAKSPSPFRSPSPEVSESTDPEPVVATTSQPGNHFATFAYPGGRSLSRVNSTGASGIRGASGKDPVPECTIRDVEMRKLKKCLFCETDWSAPGKKTLVRVKWAHLYAHSHTQTPPLSLPLLTSLLTAHLANPDTEPKTLLESLTMKKAKAKRVKGAKGVLASVVLPAGTDIGREGIMRNVENLIAGNNDGSDEDTDLDDEAKPPPSTQAFGVSGLSARFGGKEDHGPRADNDDDSEEEDSESGSRSSTGGEETENEPGAQPERLRPSLWGLAGDTTSTQLSKAGDENISLPPHRPTSPVKRADPVPLAPTQTIISLSSSSSSDSDSPPHQPDLPNTSISSSEKHRLRLSSAAPQRSRSSPRRSGSQDSGPEQGDEGCSTSQEQEDPMARRSEPADERSLEDSTEMEVDDVRASPGGGRHSRNDSTSYNDPDHDMDEPHDISKSTHHTLASSKERPRLSAAFSEYEDLSPDIELSEQSLDIPNFATPVPSINVRESTSASRASPRPSPIPQPFDFWATSSTQDEVMHSTPSRPSASQQEIIDLSDGDDWGDGNNVGVLQWDDVVAYSPTREEDRSLREAAPAPLDLPPEEVLDDEDGDELYDQSDDRWGEEQGVLVWDDRLGDLVGDGEGGVAEEILDDTEEEEDRPPTPPLPPKKTSSAAKGKGKAKAAPKMPDYDEMTVPQLQKHVKAYGTKPSTSKTQLVRLLKEYWDLVHPPGASPSPPASPPPPKVKPKKKRAVLRSDDEADDEIIAIDPPPASRPKAKGKGKATEVVVVSDEWDSDEPLAIGSQPHPKKKVASKARKKAVVAEEEEGGKRVVDPEDLPELFRTMIVDNEDEDLWLRVLRYEPVDFAEFTTLVYAEGIKCKGWQIALKKWLDSQCITYFTEEQQGPRKRH